MAFFLECFQAEKILDGQSNKRKNKSEREFTVPHFCATIMTISYHLQSLISVHNPLSTL